jgi:hypothetical protein
VEQQRCKSSWPSNRGFRARSGEPFALSAEAATREEALQKVRDLMVRQLAAGLEVVPCEVPASDDPWAGVAGLFREDPFFSDWQQAVAEYRRQVHEDPVSP